MNSTLTLLVMAAGMGSRYGGLKQVEGFGPRGEPLLAFSLRDAQAAGFGRVVFIIREAIESAFREHVIPWVPSGMESGFVYQELDACLPDGAAVPPGRQKPWGTGHAVLVARERVREPFAVINADDFYGAAAYREAADFLRQRSASERQFALVAYRLGRTLSEHGTVSRGVCSVDEEGGLVDLQEYGKIIRQDGCIRDLDTDTVLEEETPVSMNLWAFTPALFPLLEEQFARFWQGCAIEQAAEFQLPAAVQESRKCGQATITFLQTEAEWFGVTYPEDRPRVIQRIQNFV